MSLDAVVGRAVAGPCIGVGATALMDVWIYGLNRFFGLPMTNWRLAGRWFWNLKSGRVFHEDIALTPAVNNELAVGWVCHYAVGIVYAGILILALPGWLIAPSLFQAWVFGMVTILPGWFLMQPGMGAGWAAGRRANRWQIRWLNLLSHTVFAVGLYGMAELIHAW